MKRTTLILGVVALLLGLGTLFGPPRAASAASSVRLSRTLVAPGDTVTVQGFGFTAADSALASIDLRVNGQFRRVTAGASTDGNGSFSTTLTIPNGTAQATYQVIARDFHGHQATQNLTVLPRAYLQAGGKVYAVYVLPQHGFFAGGAGFQAGETIRLTASFPLYDGNTVLVNKAFAANAKGAFHEVFVRVPRDAKAGLATITAFGESSKRTGKNTLHVFYRPSLTLGAGTIRPGTSVDIRGHEFVPNSTVHVSLTIARNGATTETLSRPINTDDYGNFRVGIGVPSNVRLGRYAITAVDSVGGSHASTAVNVSVHPTISLQPSSVLPGQAFTISGENFASGVSVTISAPFPLQGGGTRTVSATAQTGSRGNYHAQIAAPGNAAATGVTVTARGANAQASAHLTVVARPAPTATPQPTGVPTATPSPTSVPTHKHHHTFDFRYISVWYHVVAAGTYNHIEVQSTLKTQLGIWVHVYFPSGTRADFYENTDLNGLWVKQFPISMADYSATNGRVVVTFRLWHGKKSIQSFSSFKLVR